MTTLVGSTFSGVQSRINITSHIMEHAIEITKEAFWNLVGNDEISWRDYRQDELTETSFYHALGCNIAAVCNFVSGVTQYYIQDINA